MIQPGEIVSIIVVYYTYKKAYEHNPHTLLIFIKTSVILLIFIKTSVILLTA